MQVDFTQQQGLYIVGYSNNPEIRSRMEDQLVADLAQQDIIAMASYADVTDIT